MTEAPPAAAAPNLFARLVGVVFSPKATMERLVASPRVLGALLVGGMIVGLSTGLPQLTESGKQAAIDAQVQQTERFTGRQVSEEQLSLMERTMPYRAWGTIIATPFFTAIGCLLFAGLYFVIFNVVLGGTAEFKQVMAVISHSLFITALGVAAGAPIQYLQGTANPMGPFTLGALLPMLDETSFLARMLGFINVFGLWGTLVTAIGLGVLYRRKTSSIAVWLYALGAVFAAIGATVVGFFTR